MLLRATERPLLAYLRPCVVFFFLSSCIVYSLLRSARRSHSQKVRIIIIRGKTVACLLKAVRGILRGRALCILNLDSHTCHTLLKGPSVFLSPAEGLLLTYCWGCPCVAFSEYMHCLSLTQTHTRTYTHTSLVAQRGV